METKHAYLKILGAKTLIIALGSVSCRPIHAPVMDVSRISPPKSGFSISESAIADETYGEVTFSSSTGTKVHLQVIPNPPNTDNTKSMVFNLLEVYRQTLAEHPNACGTFNYRSYEARWYGLKVKYLSPKGETTILVETTSNFLIVTISGGYGTEFSKSAVDLAIQLFDANSEALKLK